MEPRSELLHAIVLEEGHLVIKAASIIIIKILKKINV